MRRTAGLSRSTQLRRREPMRRSNPKRRKALFELQYGARGGPVREMPCLVANHECRGRIQAAHTVSKPRGGTKRDLVPLCAGHHMRQHRIGWPEFAQRYNIDPHQAAARVARELDDSGIP